MDQGTPKEVWKKRFIESEKEFRRRLEILEKECERQFSDSTKLDARDHESRDFIRTLRDEVQALKNSKDVMWRLLCQIDERVIWLETGNSEATASHRRALEQLDPTKFERHELGDDPRLEFFRRHRPGEVAPLPPERPATVGTVAGHGGSTKRRSLLRTIFSWD